MCECSSVTNKCNNNDNITLIILLLCVESKSNEFRYKADDINDILSIHNCEKEKS